MSSGDLTTTSYAILSQLALKPWSAYELAQQRLRYLHLMWPRAESGIYREVKHLAELGLANAEQTHIGRRPRTVYTITDAGIDALREWLATPVQPLALEFEALLRVFMAPLGSKEDLLRTLERVEDDVSGLLQLAVGIRLEYLEGRAPFQHQVYVRALTVDFLVHFLLTVSEWVERTKREVESWSDVSPDGKNERALELIAALDPARGLPRASRS